MILRIIAYVIRKLIISPLEFFNTIFQNLALFPEQREKFILMSLGIYEVLLNAVLFSYVNWKTFGLYTIVKVFFCNTLGLVLLGFFLMCSKTKYNVEDLYDVNECEDLEDITEKKGEDMYTSNENYNDEFIKDMSEDSSNILKSIKTDFKVDINLSSQDNNIHSEQPSKQRSKQRSNILESEDITEKEDIIEKEDITEKEDMLSKDIVANLSKRYEIDEDDLLNSQSVDVDYILEQSDKPVNMLEDMSLEPLTNLEEELTEIKVQAEKDFNDIKTLTNYHESTTAKRKRNISRHMSARQLQELNKSKEIFN